MKNYHTWKRSRVHRVNKARPIKEVFTRVYEEHQWGGAGDSYCSGSGSSGFHASQYAAVVKQLIQDKGIKTMIDLGCGDFVVGRALRTEGVKYIGIDIVDNLIHKNLEAYGDAITSFQSLDMVKDQLPDGDLCIIRQVFQHLSNKQIVSVLQKTKKFKYILITEHYPAPFVKIRVNVDKIHGPDTRIHDDSAVFLDEQPFNVPTQSITLISDIEAQMHLVHKGERLKTFLIQNAHSF